MLPKVSLDTKESNYLSKFYDLFLIRIQKSEYVVKIRPTSLIFYGKFYEVTDH